MKTKSLLFLTSATLVLSGCMTPALEFPSLKFPESWASNEKENLVEEMDISHLKNWWFNFNDSTLNALIEKALENNPDRKIAKSRISEVRAIRKTTQASLFPEIGFGAEGGRLNNGQATGNYYETGFDASFEVDIFGVNRNRLDAADSRINSFEAQYQDISLTLIAEVARVYADFRGAQKKIVIANKNLIIQKQTLALIRQQYGVGETPLLDVERSESLVNTTEASIPDFKSQADRARLQLTVLTGMLPKEVLPMIQVEADIASLRIEPILISSASVLNNRPDIRASIASLTEATSLSYSAAASILPTFSLSAFYGVGKTALINSANIWTLAGGTAVSLLNFGKIEGEIDASREREKQAFENYRKTFLNAIVEVESALVGVIRLSAQGISIDRAYNNAENSLKLSQQLFVEGEISFIDLLDAQRTLNEADTARVSSQQVQVNSVISLYKAMGVY
jgi:NodT family efflux transporter outer membrane factor (OMF) lipoprotein